MTTTAKIAAIPNATELKPSTIATDAAKALTVAECALGIPPLETNKPKSIRLLRINAMNTFISCATTHAQIDTKNTALMLISYSSYSTFNPLSLAWKLHALN
jgi:hypothetical protein